MTELYYVRGGGPRTWRTGRFPGVSLSDGPQDAYRSETGGGPARSRGALTGNMPVPGKWLDQNIRRMTKYRGQTPSYWAFKDDITLYSGYSGCTIRPEYMTCR